MPEIIEIHKKDVFIEEWEQALKELKKGDEYRIITDGFWIEWRDEFIDTLVMGGDFIVAIRKAKKIPFPSNDDLANAFRSVGKSMCSNGLNVSENKEAKEPQDKTEQAHRQIGNKPPQYQIGIDTFERSKANQMAETRVEIAKFMIDKYNWRNKGQDVEDFQKIKDYCDFAIEALNEMEGKNV